MDASTAARLLELNHAFYEDFGDSFSATRGRLQPGVLRSLESLRGDESVLDLGCGNGGLVRELGRRGHRGRYLGIDSSLPLLHEARRQVPGLPATFLLADLTQLSLIAGNMPVSDRWSWIACFAVLHHLPGSELRLEFLRAIHGLVAGQGRLVLSNWQFLNSPRLRARLQPWEAAGLSQADVDAGDYLLDWKRNGAGLRYAHHFSPEELNSLAVQTGFQVIETFLSDGESGNLGLYQVWTAASG